MVNANITGTKNVTLGNVAEISWIPTSSLYYKIKYMFGNWTYTTPPILPNSDYVGRTYTWDQDIMYIHLAEQIPTSTSGVATVYLYTYSDSSCATQVGETSSSTFVITVPESLRPTINTITANVVNNHPQINSWEIAVCDYTRVCIGASASGQHGAYIASYTISGPYNTTIHNDYLSYTGDTIKNSGIQTFSVVATDSRGLKSLPKTISTESFYIYMQPWIDKFDVERQDNSSVSGGTIFSNYSFDSLGGRNTCTGKIEVRRSTESEWRTIANNVRSGQEIQSNDISMSDNTSTWLFRLTITDNVGCTNVMTREFQTSSVLLDFKAGGKGLGVGKIAERDGYMEVALSSLFEDEVHIWVRDENWNRIALSLYQYILAVVNTEAYYNIIEYTWENVPITQRSSTGTYYTATGIKISDPPFSNEPIGTITSVLITHWEGSAASFTPYIQGEDVQDVRIRIMSDVAQTVSKIKLRITYIPIQAEYRMLKSSLI